MMSQRKFHPARFLLEGLSEMPFLGFTDKIDWNGWACPYFPYDTATDILVMSQTNGYRWSYDAETKAFLVNHRDDLVDSPPERFEGVEIELEHEKIVLYPIGAYSWTWRFTT